MANTANTTSTTYSNNFDFQQFYGMTNRTPAQLKMILAKQLLEAAARQLSRSERELRESLENYADDIDADCKARKAAREKAENAGREELVASTDATSSADYGKVDAV
jgi:hypothetical protein